MSSTQPNLTLNIYENEAISINLLQKPQKNYSSKGDTPTGVIKLCFHGNILFSSLLGPVFNILVNFSPEILNQDK